MELGVNATDSELQRLLADEKQRSDQHKNNYLQLKETHKRLQEEYEACCSEANRASLEGRQKQEKLVQMLDDIRQERANLQSENADLKAQVLTPQRLELIRLEVLEEHKTVIQKNLDKLEKEIEYHRNESNKLRYEYSFLKSEYEREQSQHQTLLEEVRLAHESEVTALRKDREILAQRGALEVEEEGGRIRNMQRENTQLTVKIKTLMTELEELRAQREQLSIQNDSANRVQNRQISEHQAAVKTLQTEKDSLKAQYEKVQKDLFTSQQESITLESRIHDLEREAVVLRGRAEDSEHKRKMEVSEMKLELVKQRGDLERERDKVEARVTNLETALELSRAEQEAHDVALQEQEQRSARKLQAAHEEDWQKIAQLQNEKLEAETKIQEMERRRLEFESSSQSDKERWEERIKTAERSREEAEKETLVLRQQLSQQKAVQEQLEREQSAVAELQNKLHKLELEMSVLSSTERELSDLSRKLKVDVETAERAKREVEETLSSRREQTEHVLAQQRATWELERDELQRRVNELDGEMTSLHSKHSGAANDHKQKKKKYFHAVKQLKDRNELLRAKLQQMKIEREAMRHTVSTDSYNNLRKRYNDLLRRHREFRKLLLAQVEEVKIGDKSFSTVQLPLSTTLEMVHFLDQDRLAEREVELLRERMSSLDIEQKKQMDDLLSEAPPAADASDPPSQSPEEVVSSS